MSHDEAARTPDASQPPAAAAGGAARRDERPRPQYGEYAPEGWTWQPPQDAAPTPEPAAAPTAPGVVPAPTTATTGVAHPTDRAWTVALLVVGAIGAVYNSFSMLALPANVLESMKLSASMLGTEAPTSFTPGPAVPAIITIGVVLQVTLWIGAVLWSRTRIRAGRLSWWVPIVAGVVAFVVVTIVGMLVLTSDPSLFESLRIAGTP